MLLYTKNGSYPSSLPEGDYGINEEGEPWWFQPLDGVPDNILATGWEAAPPSPIVDDAVEHLQWDGSAWQPIPWTAQELADRARAMVPSSVTPRQLRLALYEAGKLEQIEQFVASGQAPMPAKISWEYATEFLRTDPMLEQFGAMLGLDDEHIDALFTAAAKIQ